MRLRAWIRSLGAVAGVLGGLVAFEGAAHAAASLTLSTGQGRNPDRVQAFRSDSLRPLWINYADCLAADTYKFTIAATGLAPGYTIQVWASASGVDCNDLTQRTGASRQCWKVNEVAPTSTATPSYQIDVAVHDILGGIANPPAWVGPGSAAADVCQTAATTDAPVGIVLHFLPLIGTGVGDAADKGFTYADIKYDLVGPAAPTGVDMKIGDQALTLEWTISSSTDVTGYQFYCEPDPNGGTKEIPANGGSAGAKTTTSSCAGSGGTSTAGTGGTSGTSGSSGTSGTAGTAGVSTKSANPAPPAPGGAGGTAGDAGAAGAAGDAGAAGTSGSAGGGGTSGSAGASGTSGSAGASGTSGSAGASGTSGSAGASGTSGASGSAGCAVTGSTCAGVSVIQGLLPDEKYRCGGVSQSNATRGTTDELTNGLTYTVGVVAVDSVGNVGKLSNVKCEAPAPINDFFSAYSRAGGEAGGGWCQMRTPIGEAPPGGLPALALLVAGVAARLRRRSGR